LAEQILIAASKNQAWNNKAFQNLTPIKEREGILSLPWFRMPLVLISPLRFSN
jgi:hypothetical protein